MKNASDGIAVALGLLAVAIAGTGTAVAATGQLVNIADGTNASQVAKVDTSGRLAVGDGAGALTVDGTVAGAQNSPLRPYFTTALQPEPWLLTLTSTSTAQACASVPVVSGRRVVVTNISGGGVVPAEVQISASGLGSTGLLASTAFDLAPGTGPGAAYARYVLAEQVNIIIDSSALAQDGSRRALGVPRACLSPIQGGRAEVVVSGYYQRTS